MDYITELHCCSAQSTEFTSYAIVNMETLYFERLTCWMFKGRSKYSNTHHKNAEDNISLDSGYCSIYTTSGLDTSCKVNEDEEAPSLEEQEPAITKPCSSSEAGRMLTGRRSRAW